MLEPGPALLVVASAVAEEASAVEALAMEKEEGGGKRGEGVERKCVSSKKLRFNCTDMVILHTC